MKTGYYEEVRQKSSTTDKRVEKLLVLYVRERIYFMYTFTYSVHCHKLNYKNDVKKSVGFWDSHDGASERIPDLL